MVMEPLNGEKWSIFWRIIFNLFQSRVTDFRFHWKQCHSSTSYELCAMMVMESFRPLVVIFFGSLNSQSKRFTHALASDENLFAHTASAKSSFLSLSPSCHKLAMHDRSPWLICFVILSSYCKHKCQVCVNIKHHNKSRFRVAPGSVTSSFFAY